MNMDMMDDRGLNTELLSGPKTFQDQDSRILSFSCSLGQREGRGKTGEDATCDCKQTIHPG